MKLVLRTLLKWLGLAPDYAKGFDDGYKTGYHDGRFGGYYE